MVPDKGGAYSTRRGPQWREQGQTGTWGRDQGPPPHPHLSWQLPHTCALTCTKLSTDHLPGEPHSPSSKGSQTPGPEPSAGPSPAPAPCQGPVRGRHPLLLADLPPPFRICGTLLPKCLSPSPEHPPVLRGLPTPSPLGAFENKPSRAACPLRCPTGLLPPRETPGPGLPAPAADGSRASPSCTLRHLDPCSTEPVPTSPPRSFGAEQVGGGGAEGTGLSPAPHAPW